MESKLSKSSFGPEHFDVSDETRSRSLEAEHAYVDTRTTLAILYGNDNSLLEVLKLCVAVEDKAHFADAHLSSLVLNFAFGAAYRETEWDNFDGVEPKHMQTYLQLDTALNMLRLAGRLPTSKYVTWRTGMLIPFLEKSDAGMGAYIKQISKQNAEMLDDLNKNHTTKIPSIIAHVTGLQDKPIH